MRLKDVRSLGCVWGVTSVGQGDWLGTWRIHPRSRGVVGTALTNGYNEWGGWGDPKHMDLIGMILPSHVEFELDIFERMKKLLSGGWFNHHPVLVAPFHRYELFTWDP